MKRGGSPPTDASDTEDDDADGGNDTNGDDHGDSDEGTDGEGARRGLEDEILVMDSDLELGESESESEDHEDHEDHKDHEDDEGLPNRRDWVKNPRKARLPWQMGIGLDLPAKEQNESSRDPRGEVRGYAQMNVTLTWTEMVNQSLAEPKIDWVIEGMAAHGGPALQQ